MSRRGENIHKRKDGRWEGRYIAYHDINGKAKYSSVYGKSYNEVKQKLIQRKAANGKVCSFPDEITMEDVLKLWLASISHGIKDSTIIKYTNLIKLHILPELGNKNISDITADTLNIFISNKLKSGRISGGELSASYARTIMIIIKSAINFAVSENMCMPLTKNLYMPKIKKRHIEILSPEEQVLLEEQLFKNIDETSIGIILALYTGMRIGEICALSWDDIDLEHQVIYVSHSLSKINENGKIVFKMCSTKTDSSNREIPIPDKILTCLKTANDNAKYEYVVSKTEEFVNPRTYEYRFHRFIKEATIRDFNFHKLRHTFATRCVASGIDVKILSEILGHSSVSTTLNLYVHPTLNDKKQQINKLCN